MKKCPFCAEDIQDAAIKCRYCGSDLNAPTSAATSKSAPVARGVTTTPRPSAPPKPAAEPVSKSQTYGLIVAFVGFILTFVSATMAGVGFLMIWVGLAFLIKGTTVARWSVGFMLALILMSIGISVSGHRVTANATSATARPASSPASPPPVREPVKQLALLSSRGYESEGGGFHIVEGEVKNISDESLKNVTVVATWYDKDGGFIKSDYALIQYNPILPGQTSPYKAMSSSNPAMEKYSLNFKSLLGGVIAIDDQRTK